MLQQKNNSLLLLSLATGTFMTTLDTMIVSITLPQIQSFYRVSLSEVEWVIIAYLLSISCLLLPFGRLSDIIGHKRVYLTGLLIFTAGSGLCGFSVGIWMLVACRIIQAAGGAMMFATNSAIIAEHIPADKRGRAFGLIAVAVATGGCTGPVLGGLLSGAFGWQSVFYINVPIGLAGIIMAFRNIPPDSERSKQPFDYPGAILAFLSLFLILLPLDLSGTEGFGKIEFVAMLAGGLLFTMIFVMREKRYAYPLLDMRLFRNRVLSASLVAAIFNFMAQFTIALLGPLYLLKIRHFSPSSAGLMYLPMPIATMMVAPLSGRFSDRYDSRILSAAGMGVMCTGVILLGFMGSDTPPAFFAIALELVGIGSGMFQSPNNNAVMSNAPSGNRGAASGTLSVMRNIGMVMGIAVSGALFSIISEHERIHLVRCMKSSLTISQDALLYGMHMTFLIASLFAAGAMIASLMKGNTRPAND